MATKRIRNGVIDIVTGFEGAEGWTTTMEEAGVYLESLDEYEKCDYIMTVCDEIGVVAQFIFEDEDLEDQEIKLLSNVSSERSFQRVLESPWGGSRALQNHLDTKGLSFWEFLNIVSENVILSVFTRFMEEGRAAGDISNLVNAQVHAMQFYDPSMLEWLIRDGLYDASLNPIGLVLFCRNTLGLSRVLFDGQDPNLQTSTGIRPLLCRWCTADMVDLLVAAGAKVELLDGDFLPSLRR